MKTDGKSPYAYLLAILSFETENECLSLLAATKYGRDVEQKTPRGGEGG